MRRFLFSQENPPMLIHKSKRCVFTRFEMDHDMCSKFDCMDDVGPGDRMTAHMVGRITDMHESESMEPGQKKAKKNRRATIQWTHMNLNHDTEGEQEEGFNEAAGKSDD